jgi:hypothetical protein
MWKLARFAAANLSRSRRLSTAIPGPCIVHKRGADILHDPWFNKVKAFCLFNYLLINVFIFSLSVSARRFAVFVINSSVITGNLFT